MDGATFPRPRRRPFDDGRLPWERTVGDEGTKAGVHKACLQDPMSNLSRARCVGVGDALFDPVVHAAEGVHPWRSVGCASEPTRSSPDQEGFSTPASTFPAFKKGGTAPWNWAA